MELLLWIFFFLLKGHCGKPNVANVLKDKIKMDLRYLPVCMQNWSSNSLRTRLSLRFSNRVVLSWSSSSDLPKEKKQPRKWCKTKLVLNLLTNANQTWRLRAASPLWQSASGERFPPRGGTPEVVRAADQAIHLKTHSWEAGTRVAAAVWYTLHQSRPLLPMEGTHTFTSIIHTHLTPLMSGCSVASLELVVFA